MVLKLLIAYNLLIVLLLGLTANNLVLPLLLLPLGYQLFVDFKHRPRLSRPTVLHKSLPLPAPKTPLLSGKVIQDRDRRLFLKLIGSTGLSLFFMSLVSKEAQATFFGSMPGPGTVSLKDSLGNKIDPAEKQPTDGYKIAQLDDTGGTYAYFGFVNKDGAWYIQRETISGANAGDYRYYKGSSAFATSWGNRVDLQYDDFENIF